MDVKNELSIVAALIGEPARAVMLWTLLDGEVRPAGDLAFEAHTSAQSASGHLAKLVAAGMLRVEARGRHRYYHIASPEVALLIEAMAALTPASQTQGKLPRGQIHELKLARTCYDHLAGQTAVKIAVAMQHQKLLKPSNKLFDLTIEGERWLTDFGIDASTLSNKRRCVARPCLDWSEREPHIAGMLGAALLKRLLEMEWLVKTQIPRVIRVTLAGRRGLARSLDITV